MTDDKLRLLQAVERYAAAFADEEATVRRLAAATLANHTASALRIACTKALVEAAFGTKDYGRRVLRYGDALYEVSVTTDRGPVVRKIAVEDLR